MIFRSYYASKFGRLDSTLPIYTICSHIKKQVNIYEIFEKNITYIQKHILQ